MSQGIVWEMISNTVSLLEAALNNKSIAQVTATTIQKACEKNGVKPFLNNKGRATKHGHIMGLLKHFNPALSVDELQKRLLEIVGTQEKPSELQHDLDVMQCMATLDAKVADDFKKKASKVNTH